MPTTFLIPLYSIIPKNQLLPANNLQSSIERNKNKENGNTHRFVNPEIGVAVSNTIILDNPEESTTSNEKSSNKFEKYSLEETNDKSVVERSHKMQIKGYLN